MSAFVKGTFVRFVPSVDPEMSFENPFFIERLSATHNWAFKNLILSLNKC